MDVLVSVIGSMFLLNVTTSKDDRQKSVNHFRYYIIYNPAAVFWHLNIIELSGACVGNMDNVDIATPKNECHQHIKKCQQFFMLHHASSDSCATALTHIHSVG
jgi:hypothetical protein